MQDKNISEHFVLSEFESSATAVASGIVNHVPSEYLPHLVALCENVLEPLRQHAGMPLLVSSGYRCPELNRAVKGAKLSQHQFGEAADLVPSPRYYKTQRQRDAILRDWYDYVKCHLEFDQAILERSGSKCWLHVSYREGRNRLNTFSA